MDLSPRLFHWRGAVQGGIADHPLVKREEVVRSMIPTHGVYCCIFRKSLGGRAKQKLEAPIVMVVKCLKRSRGP